MRQKKQKRKKERKKRKERHVFVFWFFFSISSAKLEVEIASTRKAATGEAPKGKPSSMVLVCIFLGVIRILAQVVFLSQLRIRQNLIGQVDLSHLLLSLFRIVSFVFVWVPLLC